VHFFVYNPDLIYKNLKYSFCGQDILDNQETTSYKTDRQAQCLIKHKEATGRDVPVSVRKCKV